jgi:hypothetical protein
VRTIEAIRGRDHQRQTERQTRPDRRRDSCRLSPQNPPGRAGMELRWCLSLSFSRLSPGALERRRVKNGGIGSGLGEDTANDA